jgi:Nucleotide modification associated domain 1
MISKTESQYREVITACKELFLTKARDYGTAWRVLRLPSITDQIFIKAQRIRSIQEKGVQKVNDPLHDEFVGIINYCVIALVQIRLQDSTKTELSVQELVPRYDEAVEETMQLLNNKNHDYGEAWRDMRVSSITDIILMKLMRVKQIENNEGKTLVSEGVRANYQDMINYAVFALILMNEQKK